MGIQAWITRGKVSGKPSFTRRTGSNTSVNTKQDIYVLGEDLTPQKIYWSAPSPAPIWSRHHPLKCRRHQLWRHRSQTDRFLLQEHNNWMAIKEAVRQRPHSKRFSDLVWRGKCVFGKFLVRNTYRVLQEGVEAREEKRITLSTSVTRWKRINKSSLFDMVEALALFFFPFFSAWLDVKSNQVETYNDGNPYPCTCGVVNMLTYLTWISVASLQWTLWTDMVSGTTALIYFPPRWAAVCGCGEWPRTRTLKKMFCNRNSGWWLCL